MRKLLLALFVMGLAATAASAQADYAGRQRTFSVSAGGFVSGFAPGYKENDYNFTPSNFNLKYGPGAFVDVRFTHWVQIEAEGRWMKWNIDSNAPYSEERHSDYLIGPRVPVKRFGSYQVWGKALFGFAKMNTGGADEPNKQAEGNFSVVPALGATLERRYKKRFTLRLVDFEYQLNRSSRVDDSTNPPTTTHISVRPYGVSVGISYRIF